MSVPERRALAGFAIATALLLAVGIPLDWTGQAIGTVFILLGMAATAIGAATAPREVRRHSPPGRQR